MTRKKRPPPRPPSPAPPAAAEPEDGLTLPTDRTRALEQTLRWIVRGASYAEVIDAAAHNFPNHNPLELYRGALANLQAAGTMPGDLLRGFALEATREIYRRLVEANDLPTALVALRQLVALIDAQP